MRWGGAGIGCCGVAAGRAFPALFSRPRCWADRGLARERLVAVCPAIISATGRRPVYPAGAGGRVVGSRVVYIVCRPVVSPAVIPSVYRPVPGSGVRSVVSWPVACPAVITIVSRTVAGSPVIGVGHPAGAIVVHLDVVV